MGYSVVGSTSISCTKTDTHTQQVTIDVANAVVAYQSAAALGTAPAEDFTWEPTVDLTPGYAEAVTPGSVRFTLGSKDYIDRNGSVLFDIDHTDGSGILGGALSYASGKVDLTAYNPGDINSGSVDAMLTTLGGLGVSEITFRTATAPVRPGSLVLQFQFFDAPGVETVTANTDGTITDTYVDGTIDYDTGICRLLFGEWVLAAGNESEPWYDADAVREGYIMHPRTVRADSVVYACVAYTYIPLDKSILGVDPVRLPTDGRVPIFRVGDVVVLHHSDDVAVASPSAGLEVDCGRTRLSRVWIFDEGNDDARVDTSLYTEDLDAGIVTINDVAGLIGPLRVEHRVEDMALVSDVQINGQLTLTRPVTHDYPADETGVSSALVIGDLFAHASRAFDQQTWTGEWSDDLIGSDTTAEYNDTQYPISVSNDGATEERWLVRFTAPTTVDVIGETSGQIATGLSISTAIAPLNPATGQPYFTIEPGGWGAGWSTGNCLRFNTYAANYPLWLARTVKQGPAQGATDSFRLQIRGDADA